MLNFIKELGLPIPSKLELILIAIIIVSITGNWCLYKKLKDKNEIIKGKEVQISVQAETIESLQKSAKDASRRIDLLNQAFNDTEKEYQDEVNKLLASVSNCKTSTPSSEIEAQAQSAFKKVLDDLADSTKKVRE